HDPLAGFRALPLARERERNELARPERTKAKVIELLFVVREHHRASFEIEPCDLIKIDRGKDERPEDRWPEHATLKQQVRNVRERRGNGKPAQPEYVAHRIRDEKQYV